MKFVVCGLPRSRTAWLANFLTYDGLYCYHEGLVGCRNLNEYYDKIGDDGDSTTIPHLLDLPDCRKVIIDRDIHRAIQFTEANYGPANYEYYSFLKDYLSKMEGLHIPFSEINNSLRQIWEYVTDIPFDGKRANMLIQLNVQEHDIYNVDMSTLKEALC